MRLHLGFSYNTCQSSSLCWHLVFILPHVECRSWSYRRICDVASSLELVTECVRTHAALDNIGIGSQWSPSEVSTTRVITSSQNWFTLLMHLRSAGVRNSPLEASSSGVESWTAAVTNCLLLHTGCIKSFDDGPTGLVYTRRGLVFLAVSAVSLMS